MKYQNIREEELKNKIAQDYFWHYDCSKIIGNVDFCVSMFQSKLELFEQESLHLLDGTYFYKLTSSSNSSLILIIKI